MLATAELWIWEGFGRYFIRNIVIDGLPRCESYLKKMLAFKWQDFLSHFNEVIYDDDNFAKGLLINNE